MLRNLKAEMARNGISATMIADLLGMHEKTAQNKISGKTQFSVPDAVKLRDTFFPELSLEYLFDPDK